MGALGWLCPIGQGPVKVTFPGEPSLCWSGLAKVLSRKDYRLSHKASALKLDENPNTIPEGVIALPPHQHPSSQSADLLDVTSPRLPWEPGASPSCARQLRSPCASPLTNVGSHADHWSNESSLPRQDAIEAHMRGRRIGGGGWIPIWSWAGK